MPINLSITSILIRFCIHNLVASDWSAACVYKRGRARRRRRIYLREQVAEARIIITINKTDLYVSLSPISRWGKVVLAF